MIDIWLDSRLSAVVVAWFLRSRVKSRDRFTKQQFDAWQTTVEKKTEGEKEGDHNMGRKKRQREKRREREEGSCQKMM